MAENNEKEEYVQCCVKNCNKIIPKKDAIKIKEKYFCRSCGTIYYRNVLNL